MEALSNKRHELRAGNSRSHVASICFKRMSLRAMRRAAEEEPEKVED